MIILPVNLGTVYTHPHTQVIYQNKKQVINDKINIYNQTGYCACMKIQGNIAVY